MQAERPGSVTYHRNAFQTAKQFVKRNGVLALYRGVGTMAAGAGIYMILQFSFYVINFANI
jgi:hypothetical protein